MADHDHDDPVLLDAVAELAERDPDLRAILDRLGPPPSRRAEPGFAALLKIMVGQQVSLASAAAIWGRLEARGPVTAASLLVMSDGDLRAVGFSQAKIRYARAVADAFSAGRFGFEALADLADAEARAALLALPGVGGWTADIYLLFCLGRLDVWPGGDLALRESLRSVKALAERPSEPQSARFAEVWRPYRGAAAQLLWQHYRSLKSGAFI